MMFTLKLIVLVTFLIAVTRQCEDGRAFLVSQFEGTAHQDRAGWWK